MQNMINGGMVYLKFLRNVLRGINQVSLLWCTELSPSKIYDFRKLRY